MRKSYFEAFRENLVPQKFWTIQYNLFISHTNKINALYQAAAL